MRGPTLGSGYIQLSVLKLGKENIFVEFWTNFWSIFKFDVCHFFWPKKHHGIFLPFFKAPSIFIKFMWRYIFLWLDVVMPSKYLGWTNYIKISTCVFVVGGFLRIFHSGCACGWVLPSRVRWLIFWEDQTLRIYGDHPGDLFLILPYLVW